MKPLIVLMVPCAVRNKENWSGRKDQSQPGKGLPHPNAGLRLILAVAETPKAVGQGILREVPSGYRMEELQADVTSIREIN